MNESPKPAEVIDPKTPEGLMRTCAFKLTFQGLRFLVVNAPIFDAKTFECLDKPEMRHEALMGFYWNGNKWTFSMYHASHRTDIDLLILAQAYGGAGTKGECSFHTDQIPFPLFPASIMVGPLVKPI